MLTLAFRFGLLAMGCLTAALAWQSWNFGDPPTWTVVLPSEPALVLESRTETYRIGNGTVRTSPVVIVAWPGGTDGRAGLNGLIPPFFSYGPESAAEIAADYRPGETAAVKTYKGAPYAAVWDWFGLLHAGFLTVLALPMLALGAFLAIALGGGSGSGRRSLK